MKKMIMVSNVEMIDEVLPYVDSYLFGIKGYSTNMPIYYSLEELEPTIMRLVESGKEVFISLNKNMHASDLEGLRELLKELDGLPISGIFYYDIALVELKKAGVYTKPIVWHQEHLTTNYNTCLFWKEQGVDMVCLSSEITLEDIFQIRENVDMPIVVPIFGYLPMFVSRRHLVDNYLKKFELAPQHQYYLKKEGYTYPIIDDETGTEVYSHHILNGVSECLQLEQKKIDYVLLNSFHIANQTMLEVLKLYQQVTENNKDEVERELASLIPNLDKGFFYKETIFKVKKNDK